jgi:hypothetical protein
MTIQKLATRIEGVAGLVLFVVGKVYVDEFVTKCFILTIASMALGAFLLMYLLEEV